MINNMNTPIMKSVKSFNPLQSVIKTIGNVLGERVLQTTLEKGNKHVIIPINNIITGIYKYKIVFDTEIITGKIAIEK